MAKKSKHVGLIGLGIIGTRVAATLRKRGFHPFVWNRTPRQEQNFVGSPAEVAELCDVVQIFVADDEALLETVRQLSPTLGAQHIVTAHCTVAPESMRAAADVVHRRGARFLDAPFTGSKVAAENGQLVYYIAGDDAALKQARPALEASSKEIVFLSHRIGDATVMKVATNLVTAATAQVAAEALALTRKAGVAPELFRTAMKSNATNSTTLEMKVPMMLAGNFEPHFSIKHMLKDVRIGLKMARESSLDLPVTEASRDMLLAELKQGRGDADYASIAQRYFPASGDFSKPEPVPEISKPLAAVAPPPEPVAEVELPEPRAPEPEPESETEPVEAAPEPIPPPEKDEEAEPEMLELVSETTPFEVTPDEVATETGPSEPELVAAPSPEEKPTEMSLTAPFVELQPRETEPEKFGLESAEGPETKTEIAPEEKQPEPVTPETKPEGGPTAPFVELKPRESEPEAARPESAEEMAKAAETQPAEIAPEEKQPDTVTPETKPEGEPTAPLVEPKPPVSKPEKSLVFRAEEMAKALLSLTKPAEMALEEKQPEPALDEAPTKSEEKLPDAATSELKPEEATSKEPSAEPELPEAKPEEPAAVAESVQIRLAKSPPAAEPIAPASEAKPVETSDEREGRKEEEIPDDINLSGGFRGWVSRLFSKSGRKS